MSLEEDLFAFCLGKENPSATLMQDGSFPEGWVDCYFQLLEQAKEQWGNDSAAPRKAVAAIHFASMYLHLRYGAWRNFNHRENHATDSALAQIRTRSELWLLGPMASRESEVGR